MDEREFKNRTKILALRGIRLVENLPKTQTAEIIGKQLLRCSTSVGANYRAACRGKSPADVLHKLAIVEEEADESLYWMELLIEAGIIPEPRLVSLMSETSEIVAMTVASIKTLRARSAPSSVPNPKSKIQNRHAFSHLPDADARSMASSTRWLRTPSLKFGSGVFSSAMALIKSRTVCVNVCSYPMMCPGGHQASA